LETIIVVGAGAAGLMAAYELSKRNKKVIVLEASARLGGRMYTYQSDEFSMPVELGAEFIHGKVPVTLELLKQGSINYHAIKGKMFHLDRGQFKKENNYSEHWNELMIKMKELKTDMSLSDFLQTFFSDDKYKNLRESVTHFAEGFDLADVSNVSTCSLYEEWSNEETIQYRIEGGYQQLVLYLESECKKNGCMIYNNCCVKKINWQKNEVNILTLCSRYFKGNKIIITVPLSVLQADKNDINYIELAPTIDEYLQAATNIGFGTVIKIILEFSEAFWQDEKKNTGFIFTNEKIPTWWTQLPKENAILTGWLGGTKAASLKNATDEDLLEASLASLASAFKKPADILKNKLLAYKINNWANFPNTFGGYSYETTKTKAAKDLLNHPVEQTIFFAGEALYSGIYGGTVEAALTSGKQAAQKIINTSH
jgi:monoamine oxidase